MNTHSLWSLVPPDMLALAVLLAVAYIWPDERK